MKNLRSFLVLLFSVVAFNVTYSQNQPIPVDKDVTIGTLANGIKYYIQKNQKPEKRAELRLIVNAGSVLENEDQLGLAHFVEHMAFNGTVNFKKNELINYLETIGIKFGPELNAYTSFDQTVYILTVPTDSVDILAKAFLVLEDWAHGLAFDPEEIDKERGVIIEEWRLGRGANMRMLDKQLPVLFKNSRYAERLPIGQEKIIESFDHQTLIDFYKDWYRPELIAVAAVGDFDVKTIENYIKQHFSNIKSPANIRTRETYPVPDHSETYFAIASDKEAMNSIVSVYYKLKPQTIKTIEDYKKDLAHIIFYGMLNDRLAELTTSAEPPFAFAYAGSSRFVKSADISFLTALVKDGGIEKGLETLLTEAERVKLFGFTATELERQKKNQLRQIQKSLDEKNKTESSNIIQDFVSNYLYNDPIISIEDKYNLYQQLIPQISLQEVNEISSELLKKDNRVILVNSPEKEGLKIPTESELQNVISKVSSLNITAYEDKVLEQPLVNKIPEAADIVSWSKVEKLGTMEWKLANGVKVIVKPTDFKNDEILFSAFSTGGSSLVSDEDYISALTAPSLVGESGVGDFNKTELDKYLTGKLVNVTPFIDAYEEGLRGNSSPKDIETLFQLIYSYFTSPRLDSVAFLSYKAKMKAMLENMSNEPQVAFRDTINTTLANYHFRSRPYTVSMLDEMNLRKSLSIYKNRFADASDFTFIFVGNIDTASFKPLIQTYLGGLPSLNRNENWKDLNYKNISGTISKNIYKGVEQKSFVGITFVGNMEWDRKIEHRFESLIDVLNIKLREVIREDKSGTYGVQVYPMIFRLPETHYNINIFFGCDPNRVEELTKAVFNVLDTIKTVGPDEKDMIKIKETQKRQRELNLKVNHFWSGVLTNYLENNEDPVEFLNYYNWVDAITAADVKQAANDYLTDNYLKVVLYPEDKK